MKGRHIAIISLKSAIGSGVRAVATLSAMRTRPFPFPLNIGTDIVHIPRIHRLINRTTKGNTTTYLDRFARRILTDREQEYFRSKFQLSCSQNPSRPPVSSRYPNSAQSTADTARWLAGRFAAKEAARKAAPDGAASVSWKDVIVRVETEGEGGGRPEVIYKKDGVQAGQVGKLSISHDGEYVIATVLAASPALNEGNEQRGRTLWS